MFLYKRSVTSFSNKAESTVKHAVLCLPGIIRIFMVVIQTIIVVNWDVSIQLGQKLHHVVH